MRSRDESIHSLICLPRELLFHFPPVDLGHRSLLLDQMKCVLSRTGCFTPVPWLEGHWPKVSYSPILLDSYGCDLTVCLHISWNGAIGSALPSRASEPPAEMTGASMHVPALLNAPPEQVRWRWFGKGRGVEWVEQGAGAQAMVPSPLSQPRPAPQETAQVYTLKRAAICPRRPMGGRDPFFTYLSQPVYSPTSTTLSSMCSINGPACYGLAGDRIELQHQLTFEFILHPTMLTFCPVHQTRHDCYVTLLTKLTAQSNGKLHWCRRAIWPPLYPLQLKSRVEVSLG